MAKIPTEFENPLDNLIRRVVESVNPVLHSVGVTPNMVTLAGGVAGFMANRNLWNENYTAALALFWLRYLADTADGNMARTYHQQSVFGDFLDHATDALTNIPFVALLAWKLPPGLRLPFLILIGILCCGVAAHLDCQERYYNRPQDSPFLVSVAGSMCPCDGFGATSSDLGRTLRTTRWLGVGSLMLFISAVLGFLQATKK